MTLQYYYSLKHAPRNIIWISLNSFFKCLIVYLGPIMITMVIFEDNTILYIKKNCVNQNTRELLVKFLRLPTASLTIVFSGGMKDIFWDATDYNIAKLWLIFNLEGMHSFLDRLFIRVICGNLVTTNYNLVQMQSELVSL